MNLSSAIVSSVVTAAELYQILIVATTATTSAHLFHAVRLRKVEIWGSPDPAVGQETTCKIEWATNSSTNLFSGVGNSVSDTVMGTGKYCHVRSRPAPNELCGFWLNGASGGALDIFEFTIPERGILDITIDGVLNYAEPAIVGPVLVAATVGTLIIRPIGGLTPVDPLNT